MRKLIVEDKWMVFAVTGLANFIATFTTSSINLALPGMAFEFGVSMSAISWVSLIYMLTLSCSLLVFGRLGDLHGYKRLFVGGFAIFSLMSLLLPLLSVNLPLLILFRCLQAVGGSMVVSITHAIVSKTFGPKERGKALGINSIFVSLGLAVGPTVGGWLLTYFSWHALFYVNIPFSLAGIIVSMRYMKTRETYTKAPVKMDWAGAVVFGLMIVSLSVAINYVEDWGMASVQFLGTLIFSLACLLLFIPLERRCQNPMMELELFRSRRFSLPVLACLCSYIAQMMTTFLMPFFLVNVLRMSQDKSGMIMLATPLIMMLSSPLGGRMTDRVGSRQPALLGLGSVALGSILMSGLGEGSSLPFILIALAFFGSGNGYSVSAINTAIYASVAKEHMGVASGMVATVRNMGQSLGVALGGMIVALRTAHYSGTAGSPGNAVYLAAQRDAFYFGVLVALTAMLAILLIPQNGSGAEPVPE